MSRVWRSAQYHYRDGGLRQLGRQLFARAMSWLNGRETWRIYLSADRLPQRASGMIHRQPMTFDDLIAHGYLRAQVDGNGIQGRFDTGSECHGFFVDGVLVNIAWTINGVLALTPDVLLDLGTGAGIYDCVTFPGHRGKGYYPASLDILLDVLGTPTRRPIFIAVDPGNIPSIKGIEAAGFSSVGQVTRTTRFGRHRVVVDGPLHLMSSNA